MLLTNYKSFIPILSCFCWLFLGDQFNYSHHLSNGLRRRIFGRRWNMESKRRKESRRGNHRFRCLRWILHLHDRRPYQLLLRHHGAQENDCCKCWTWNSDVSFILLELFKKLILIFLSKLGNYHELYWNVHVHRGRWYGPALLARIHVGAQVSARCDRETGKIFPSVLSTIVCLIFSKNFYNE